MSYPSCQEAGAQALTLPGELEACCITMATGGVGPGLLAGLGLWEVLQET